MENFASPYFLPFFVSWTLSLFLWRLSKIKQRFAVLNIAFSKTHCRKLFSRWFYFLVRESGERVWDVENKSLIRRWDAARVSARLCRYPLFCDSSGIFARQSSGYTRRSLLFFCFSLSLSLAISPHILSILTSPAVVIPLWQIDARPFRPAVSLFLAKGSSSSADRHRNFPLFYENSATLPSHVNGTIILAISVTLREQHQTALLSDSEREIAVISLPPMSRSVYRVISERYSRLQTYAPTQSTCKCCPYV